MRLVLLCVGILSTAAMLAISMRLNYLFGASLGQTPERAQVFGWVSVVADSWKATGPIFIYALVRSRRGSTAAAASILWLVCFCYAVSSALGLAVQDRMTITSGRETLRVGFEDVRSELEQKEGERKALAPHRSVVEVEAGIAVLLARPVMSGRRVRGTVASISGNCMKSDARTAERCAEVAVLRQELAVAREAARLDGRIVELKARALELRGRGGTLASDPQAELLSRLSIGWVSAQSVSLALVLLLAGVIELVSAFGPVVVNAYAEATGKNGEGDQLDSPGNYPVRGVMSEGNTSSRGAAAAIEDAMHDGVTRYIADRVAPAGGRSEIEAGAIFSDYQQWCAKGGEVSLDRDRFLDQFDLARREHHLEQTIRKIGDRYYGMQVGLNGD